ncbi:MAG TPA: class I SAM-dependent methyltransferase [Pyrinomonadaceae bacterium]|jgi:SAM-dependent methyltransferase|nr:class I SAM-dependent methyltransferase [Pyrinomonadaceae bacterium]
MKLTYSKFATVEDVFSDEFAAINRDLDALSARYGLADHTELNEERYPWSAGVLGKPAFYAARLWEYPFALLAAELQPGMSVADIGCGMTAFTIYLKEHARCRVSGVDPDIFDEGVKYLAHGVGRDFIERTGLTVLKGDFDAIPLETDSQDRVFSISVMEHVEPDVRRRGIQEIARVLKPGGRAIITVDMSMWFELNRPLELVWDSGLTLFDPVDLRWPTRRFGMFSDTKLPADVFGMTLLKEDRQVETQYRHDDGGRVETVPAYRVPALSVRPTPAERPLWRRVGGRLAREVKKVAGD